MLPLTGKNVVVIGGSRGVGRRVVEAALYNGARVLAVARQEIALRQLAKERGQDFQGREARRSSR
jgi:NAD(P)-dependent dehydrogenase (short-subunit alcohol dehydrogenase family)